MAVYLCPACGSNLRIPGSISRVYVNSIPWWKFDSSSVRLPLKFRCNHCDSLLKHMFTPKPFWVRFLGILGAAGMVVTYIYFEFWLKGQCSEAGCFDLQCYKDLLEELIYLEVLLFGVAFLPSIIEDLTSKRHVYTIFQ